MELRKEMRYNIGTNVPAIRTFAPAVAGMMIRCVRAYAAYQQPSAGLGSQVIKRRVETEGVEPSATWLGRPRGANLPSPFVVIEPHVSKCDSHFETWGFFVLEMLWCDYNRS